MSIEFPAPAADDAEDVVFALETAGALWKRGDAQDSIRWVRRAAESAEESGNDMRALTLARTAADLTTAHEKGESVTLPGEGAKAPRSKSSFPTPKPMPGRRSSAPPAPGIAAAAAAGARPASESTPAPRPPVPVPTPPASSATTPAPPAVISAAPVSLPNPVAAPATAPVSSPTSSPRASVPPPSSPLAAAAPKEQRKGPPPPPPPPPSAATPSPQKGGATTKAKNRPAGSALQELASLAQADLGPGAKPVSSPTALRSLRVAITISKDEDHVLCCKILGEDEIAASGAKNGLLVISEPVLEQLAKKFQ